MLKNILLAMSAAFAAAAKECDGDTSTGTSTPAAEPTGDAPKRGRGRPPGGGAAANPDEGKAAAGGTSDAERYEANRKLFEPLIKEGRVEEVKAVVAKYSATGLKDLKASDQAAFEKDINALLI